MSQFAVVDPSTAVAGHLYENGLQNKPAGELLKEIGNGHASPAEKKLTGEELERRLDSGEIGQKLTPEEKEEVKKLLGNMKDGTISPDGTERLTQLLHPSQTAGHDTQDIR